MDQSGKKQNEPMVIEDEYPQKPVPQVEKVDYSGAHEKTDPKEIALVKKLDRWIMASSFPSLYSAGGVMRLQPRLTELNNSRCFGACIGSITLTETLLPWHD